MKQSVNEKTDEILAVEAQSGDPESMDELLARYRAFVKVRARGLFLLGGETEDLVQEGMIGLFKAIRDYNESKGSSFNGFARICVFRQFYTAIKLANRVKHHPLNNYVPLNDVEELELFEQFDPEEALIGREETERFSAFVAGQLSGLERKILEEYLAGRSYDEIAVSRNVPKKTVDNALQRIKKKWSRESE